MIYYTSTHNRDKLAQLYKEWTGLDLRGSTLIPANLHFIAAVDDETGDYAGALSYTIVCDTVFNRTWALVENVFVGEQYRRQGIGEGLIHFGEDQARLMGCSFLKLTSRKVAGKALYRKLGYDEGSSFYKNF